MSKSRVIAEFGSSIDDPIARCSKCGCPIELPLDAWVWLLIGYLHVYHKDGFCCMGRN